MPFLRRTLTQLRDGALQDIAASSIYDATTGQVVNPLLLMFDPLTILAKVLAGLAYEEYGYLDYIALQSNPYTATDETALAWGALKNITLKPATAAQAIVQFAGTPGTDVPAGTVVARSDGTLYQTTVDVEIASTETITAPITATVTGAFTTLVAGAALAVNLPIPGVVTQATVTATVAPGTDIETEDAFRARYLKVYQTPPAGGAASDYEDWALAVPGVTRAWTVGNQLGAGTVAVYVMLDTSEAGNLGFPVGTNGVAAAETRGTAATGDQLTVANAIYPLRPVTALVYVIAPTPMHIPFNLANLGTAANTTTTATVLAALQELMLSIGDPTGTTIYPSSWEAALSAALGTTTYTLVSPVGPITVPLGSLPIVEAADLILTA